jgi:hypothetical protein
VTDDLKFELLRDLARLIKRYGPATFSDLATYLRDQEGVSQLLSVLDTGARAGRHVRADGVGATGRRPLTTRALLAAMERSEPDKARVLKAFYEALTAKHILPTLHELRGFVDDSGLTRVVATTREKAVPPLIRDLARRTIPEIQTMLAGVRMEAVPGDRTLQGWADIILKHRDTSP